MDGWLLETFRKFILGAFDDKILSNTLKDLSSNLHIGE
jgi:hypothetical protein